jgi:hypothetical protein
MLAGVWTSRFELRYLSYGWVRPDGNSRRPNGCSNLLISVFWKEILKLDRTLRVIRTGCWNVQTNASWSNSKLLDTEKGQDGNLRCPDGCCYGQLGVRTVWHVVRTDGRESNFLTCKLCRIFWKHFWIAKSLLKSIITMKWFCPTECSQLQINKYHWNTQVRALR